MARTHTRRGTVAKAIIAVAVLMPALLILAVAVTRQMVIYGVRIGNLTPWIIGDTMLLGLGLMLHRGEDL
jgi:hypothetical protein